MYKGPIFLRFPTSPPLKTLGCPLAGHKHQTPQDIMLLMSFLIHYTLVVVESRFFPFPEIKKNLQFWKAHKKFQYLNKRNIAIFWQKWKKLILENLGIRTIFSGNERIAGFRGKVDGN